MTGPSPYLQCVIVSTKSGRVFLVTVSARNTHEATEQAKYMVAYHAESPAWDSCFFPRPDNAYIGMKELF